MLFHFSETVRFALLFTAAEVTQQVLPWLFVHLGELLHHPHYLQGARDELSLHFSPLAAGRGQDVRILHSSVPSSEEEGKTEGGGGGGEAGMHFEFRPVLHYFLWGFAVYPHLLRAWYAALDSRRGGKTKYAKQYVLENSIRYRYGGNSWGSVAKKIAIDQIFFPAPILVGFYLFLSLLEGRTGSLYELTAECRAKLPATIKARYCFWLPAQAINFSLVPPRRRIAFVGVATFFWLNVLCVIKRMHPQHTFFQ